MRIKQVIVMRRKYKKPDGSDFSLRRGKEIAQGAHASMAFLSKLVKDMQSAMSNGLMCEMSSVQRDWLEGSFAKVTLQVDTEEDLQKVYQEAKDANLVVELIVDSGRTEFDGVPTPTCLAIGPDDAEKIDVITGDLRLY